MSFLSNLLLNLEGIFFSLLILFLPSQLGKHFWPDFSLISGIRVDYLSPTIYLTDIFVLLLFITWLISKVQSSEFKVQSYGSKLKIFSVVFLFLLINIFVSHNVWNGLYHLLKFLEFSFVTYYVASSTKTVQQIKKIFFFLGIGVIFESFLAGAQFIQQASIGGLFYFLGERTFTAATPGIANASIQGELILRAYGTFSHPNVLAGFLLVSMICLVFSLPWARKGVEKIFWIVAILLGTSMLLLTMSRIAIVLWIFILVLLLIATAFQKERVNSKIQVRTQNGFLILTTVLFSMIILLSPFGARFLQTNVGEESVVMREVLIRGSGELLSKQPVVGVGFGNFIPMLSQIEKPFSLTVFLQPVHNIFLLILVETGLIGFIFFLWFIVKTYQKLFSQAKRSAGFVYRIFIVALTTILILGSFDHYFLTLQQGQLLFGLILGLCWTKLKV